MSTEKREQIWNKDKLLEYTQSIVGLDVAIKSRYEIRKKISDQIEANEQKIREVPEKIRPHKDTYPEGSKALKITAIVCAILIAFIYLVFKAEGESLVEGGTWTVWIILGIPVIIYFFNSIIRAEKRRQIDEKYNADCAVAEEKDKKRLQEKQRLNAQLNKKNEENQALIQALEEDIEKLQQSRQEMASWNVFPQIYTNTEAMAWIYEYFASDRVDTVREAIYLYVQESQMLRIQEKLERLTNEMQDRAYKQSELYHKLIASNQAMADATNIRTAIMEDSMKRLNESQKMIEYYQEMNYINQKYN